MNVDKRVCKMICLCLTKASEFFLTKRWVSCIWERESWIYLCVIYHKLAADTQQLNIYYKQ